MDGIARSEHVAIVAMPRTPGSSALRGARAEAKMIRGLFGERAAILQGRGATHKAVADALPLYPWAHFACHGSSDVQDPSRSHLLLSDYRKRPLTVMEVSRLRLERAEFAFLSACSTAKTGVTLPDEAIHLASAFQVAGYRSVIATLWEIDDRVATQIAERVYRKLAITEDADDAAAALHDAVCAAREIHRAQPSRWAAHIHHGV